jgi:iron complex transport system substrate-binding protein
MPLRPFAARLAVLLFAALSAAPAVAAEFTDSAGRRLILPDHISRAMAANMSAEVLVFVLAPDELAGWVQPPIGKLPPRFVHLPLLGPITDPAAAVITRLRPDVIIDVGDVTPDRAAFADQVTQATGTPYILLDGSFDRMPTMLRVTGRVLGVADRGDDLAGSAEHAINSLRGRLLIQSALNRPRVYYGRGFNGLEPARPSTPAAAAIEDAGAINVAALPGADGPAVVTRQQVQEWNPDIIIAETTTFYDALIRDPGWRSLAAVRNKHVYLEPAMPFGWIDDPPGVNRLIGLYWLSVLLYPGDNQNDVRSLAQDFYDKFYGIALSDKQIDATAKTAGIPASDTPHLGDLPLGGTGLPGTAPPGRGGVTPLPQTTPSYLMPK